MTSTSMTGWSSLPLRDDLVFTGSSVTASRLGCAGSLRFLGGMGLDTVAVPSAFWSPDVASELVECCVAQSLERGAALLLVVREVTWQLSLMVLNQGQRSGEELSQVKCISISNSII